jgi:homoserine O-acetyltransferase
MDSHDVTHGRLPHNSAIATEQDLRLVLGKVPPKALVVSVETDILFRPEQQLELAKCLPDARLVSIASPDGHDGFLLEFETLNDLIVSHLRDCHRSFYANESEVSIRPEEAHTEVLNSVFGEAEILDF